MGTGIEIGHMNDHSTTHMEQCLISGCMHGVYHTHTHTTGTTYVWHTHDVHICIKNVNNLGRGEWLLGCSCRPVLQDLQESCKTCQESQESCTKRVRSISKFVANIQNHLHVFFHMLNKFSSVIVQDLCHMCNTLARSCENTFLLLVFLENSARILQVL